MGWWSFYVLVNVVVTATYLLLARDAWRSLVPTAAPDGSQRVAPAGLAGAPSASSGLAGASTRTRWTLALFPVAVFGHAWLLGQAMFPGSGFHFGFAHALSATFWVAAIVVWIEGLVVSLRGLEVVVLPLAALAASLTLGFPGTALDPAADTPALRLHLLMAILAYSLFTVAAMHAGLMAALHRHLHADRSGVGLAARLFARVPPLLALETLLFRLIGGGFVLLSATLLTGVFFSEQLFGRALRFDHKTVFAIAAWLVFGLLLVGRTAFGWRGRTALRWTLAGFVMLLFAYIGTRFVLEVILGRT